MTAALDLVDQTLGKLKAQTDYVYSLSRNGDNSFKTVWSRPTKEKPIADPVVTVILDVEANGTVSFHFENNLFKYTDIKQLNFERALDAICDSKRVSVVSGVWNLLAESAAADESESQPADAAGTNAE